MSSGHSEAFERSHELAYAVRPVQYHVNQPNLVLSVECLFCVHFGREEKVGAKRKARKNVKYFRFPFRADNYTQHHRGQHPANWQRYEPLSVDQKKAFFSGARPVRTTLHQYFGASQVTRVHVVKKSIVDVIIGDMLWDPENLLEGDTRARMMSSFSTSEGTDDPSNYEFEIRNPAQFDLAVDHLSVNCSFRQTAFLLTRTKERTGLASLGSCSDSTISKYARYVCAINLQSISDMLSKSWAFAVSLDMSTHFSTSYLDVRLRLHSNRTGIVNCHFLAIPVFERHTAEVIFNTISKALDAVCTSWRDVILSSTTDGEKKMTGSLNGVVTRFQRVAQPGFIRVWCVAHQLDLVLQKVYKRYGDDEFYSSLTRLIGYLRRQHNLINEMRTKVPTVADTRWESMASVTAWFSLHRVRVFDHVLSTSPVCKPSPQWWVMLMVVHEFATCCRTTFRTIQGPKQTVNMQRHAMSELCRRLLGHVNGRGPLSVDQVDQLGDSWLPSDCNRFAIDREHVQNFILDMGTFVHDRIDEMDSEAFIKVVDATASLYLLAISGIFDVVCERDSNNDPSTVDFPPVVRTVRNKPRTPRRTSPVRQSVRCISLPDRDILTD